MDSAVSRAIVLKAILEYLQKERGITHHELYESVPIDYRGPFTRANATEEVLRKGLRHWIAAIEPHADALKDMAVTDPVLPLLVAFARSGELPPPAPPDFPIAEWRQPLLKDQIVRELGGTWHVFRLSAQRDSSGDPMVNQTILGIAPRSHYAHEPSDWTHFSMWQQEDHPDAPSRVVRIDGVCMHHVNLHMMGLLDRVRANIPTVMMFRYQLGGRRSSDHVAEMTGVALMTNSAGKQTAAHVEAIFQKGSEAWSNDDFRKHRQTLLLSVGSRSRKEYAHLLSEQKYEKLRRLSTDVVYQ